MIQAKDLDNPERELELERREEAGEERGTRRRELAGVRDKAAALELENTRLRAQLEAAEAERVARRARLEAAKRIKPKGSDLHCSLCWSRGRDAAIREAGGDET